MIGFIVQARSGSTRLPNKVLTPFFENRGILEIILRNIQASFPSYTLVLATTTSPKDDAIEALANSLGVICFRGSEENVLQRFSNAAEANNLDTVVRICADNPFLNMDLLNELVNSYNDADYYSYALSNGTPVIKTHWGLFGEIVKLEALKKTALLTEDKLYLEHVTNYIYGHPAKFQVEFLSLPSPLKGESGYRFTIDNEFDFDACASIYQNLKEETQNLDALLKYVQENELKKMMQNQIDKYEK